MDLLGFYYWNFNGKVKRKWRFPKNSEHFYVFLVGFPAFCYKMEIVNVISGGVSSIVAPCAIFKVSKDTCAELLVFRRFCTVKMIPFKLLWFSKKPDKMRNPLVHISKPEEKP